MNIKQTKALKATLEHLALLHPSGILIYGEDTLNKRTFCQPINLLKAKDKLLSCVNIEIRGIGYYIDVESTIVSWLQSHIRLPTNRQWLRMASPSNWLRYNFDKDLYILHLSIAHRHYYICLRREYVSYYRQIALH